MYYRHHFLVILLILATLLKNLAECRRIRLRSAFLAGGRLSPQLKTGDDARAAAAISQSPTAQSSRIGTQFVSECQLPTSHGRFRLRSYRHTSPSHSFDIIAILSDNFHSASFRGPVPLRLHDQCTTSEAFLSRRCDCKEQLDAAMEYIHANSGVILYLQQEGRGIGLANKVAAYSLQDQGFDTVDANRHLGFEDDARSYASVPFILHDLKIDAISLMTNNPRKVRHLVQLGAQVENIIPLQIPPTEHNRRYLETKSSRMFHVMPRKEWEELVERDPTVAFPDSRHTAADAVHSAARLPSETFVNRKGPVECGVKAHMGPQSVERAIEALRRGEVIVVTDDESRENEGDLILAAEKATAKSIAFMIRHTSGVLCVSMEGDRLDELRLPPMATLNEDPKQTAYAVSCDYNNNSTGISATNRALTVRGLGDPSSRPTDFTRPGHVFPLRAHPGGVLARAGHTEASVDFCKLAKLYPAAAIGELVSKHHPTEMAKRDEVRAFAEAHALAMTTIEDLIAYIKQGEKNLELGEHDRLGGFERSALA